MQDLFAYYARGRARKNCLRSGARASARADEATRAQRIGDYIAGMTDRYALIEHARLFDSTPELR